MKVLELFGGIGACTASLKQLGVDFEVVDYVEIDKYAVSSYNAINSTNFEPQDITKWDKDLQIDLIMHGSPCQDFSIAGKQAGGDLGTGTRSSLMYETIRIVSKLRPKYVVWENVKNLLSKKHRHNFDAYLETMKQLGYINYYQVLNAKDYGIPQNRERIFTISILDNQQFTFPQQEELKLKLKDLLEDDVEEKYYLSDEQINKIKHSTYTQNKRRIQEKDYVDTLCARDLKDPKCVQIADYRYDEGLRIRKNGLSPCLTTKIGSQSLSGNTLLINVANKKGYMEAVEGDSVNLSYPNSKTKRGRVGKQVAQTLDTGCNLGVVIDTYSDKSLEKIKANIRDIEGCSSTITANPQRATIDSGNLIIEDSLKTKNKRIQKLVENTEFGDETLFMDICNQKTNVEMTGTLKSGMDHQQGNIIYDTLRIRKLTPKECWRLMGFSDSTFEKASNVCSNSQLYKQAGNSIVVNVLVKIFTNLFKNNNEITIDDYIEEEDLLYERN